LQVFLNEEISKYEILDMVCAMRSFKNVNEDNKEWLESDVCELGFHHTDCINATAKQTGQGWGR
jgi:hypothetical protein